MSTLIAIVFVALFGILVVACSGNAAVTPAPAPSPNLPSPTTLRTDLLYGYYGSDTVQLGETEDHVNVHMAMQWGGNELQLQEMIKGVKAGKKLIVEFHEALEGESAVRLRLNTFKENGLLESIVMWYIQDEPEKAGYTESEIVNANKRLKSIALEYGITAKTGVIYSADMNFIGITSYDYVGVDKYDAGDKVFTDGTYMGLKQKLRSDQEIILVPGGANPWMQDPEQFFNMAEYDMQVRFIIPFLWIDRVNPDGKTQLGIRSNGMRVKYWNLGNKIRFQM